MNNNKLHTKTFTLQEIWSALDQMFIEIKRNILENLNIKNINYEKFQKN